MIRSLLALAVAGMLVAADQPPPRYLDGMPVPDLLRILPPPPAPGSARAADDRRTFEETRGLEGSPRWALATRDVAGDGFSIFACAIGARLDAARSPALARVFARMGDGGMTGRAKAGFGVRRPFLYQAGEICEPRTAHLAGNGDYPSGHTVTGWTTALVLAELMPDRATDILRRGRVYGESRFVCGSHNRSAVEAGYMAAAVQVAALHADPAFRADMDAARSEIDAARRTAPAADAGRCLADAIDVPGGRANR